MDRHKIIWESVAILLSAATQPSLVIAPKSLSILFKDQTREIILPHLRCQLIDKRGLIILSTSVGCPAKPLP
jgi:hypothetical protein